MLAACLGKDWNSIFTIKTGHFCCTSFEHCKNCKKDIIEDQLHLIHVCDCYNMEYLELANNAIGINKK